IYYITGIVRHRHHAGQIEQLVRATAETDGDTVQIYLEQEPASNSEFMADHFKREVLRGFAVYTHRPSGSKETRAQIAAAAAANPASTSSSPEDASTTDATAAQNTPPTPGTTDIGSKLCLAQLSPLPRRDDKTDEDGDRSRRRGDRYLSPNPRADAHKCSLG